MKGRALAPAFAQPVVACTYLGDDSLLGQRLANTESNGEGGGLPARALLDAAVGQGDGDGLPGLRCFVSSGTVSTPLLAQAT